ncbi:phage major capsid protein [Dichotomicrobium thermohalophilum]|uniref:HK97 family phage major capsid protein n=1 Tax=Dichotomicrobium thermohalophilum TaxID=933063 RepID=A0A397Q6T8_9HYPH|nr:phage major capsid protein [Dichotomicrobium thermohalophilum]RIA56768.1 HK97 family phage major capsid protein [Dichotomicrobium thermohalophilum]
MSETYSPDYETKAEPQVSAVEMAQAFDEFMRAFEAFKESNDQRLQEIEQRMAADVVTTDKLERINRALDEHKRTVDQLALKAARPPREGSAAADHLVSEHKAAFASYVRAGETASLRALEQKALSAGSGADGGYTVPTEVESTIMRALTEVSPIRAIAGNRQVSSATYKKPFARTGAAAGWVAETGARSETNTPVLEELDFPTMELYAMPAATQTLLDDSAVDIEAWIADEVRIAFAAQENTAFVSGNGTDKPKGFLDYTQVADGSWSWGSIGYIATGVDGDFASTDPEHALFDLIYTLKAGYRGNASWVMNRSTQAEVRKIKDGDGNYIWQPATEAGARPMLLGFPIVETEDMPSIGSNATAIAFGDFQRGYLVVDRIGIRVLRDPFSSKPYVLFYTTKRVGGGVQDFGAIKLLKFGTS